MQMHVSNMSVRYKMWSVFYPVSIRTRLECSQQKRNPQSMTSSYHLAPETCSYSSRRRAQIKATNRQGSSLRSTQYSRLQDRAVYMLDNPGLRCIHNVRSWPWLQGFVDQSDTRALRHTWNIGKRCMSLQDIEFNTINMWYGLEYI